MGGRKTNSGPKDRLSILSRLAGEVGSEPLAREADGLIERLREGRFYVACVGQFKRGKSTIINALVGSTSLPAGIVPITTAVTVVRYGDRLAARVRLGEHDWEDCDPGGLATYVSEEYNPNNEKGVSGVEVFVPSALLVSGMCLVDTPGIGSVSTANTAATRAFVPHIDAALVVLGADPPISGEELDLLETIGRDVRDLIFVLNKADRLTDEQLGEAARFTERIVSERLGRPIGPLFRVSAVEQLGGRVAMRDWPELVGRLQTLAQESGADLVHQAEERGVQGLCDRLLHDVEEQGGALMRPIEESRRRVQELRRAVNEAEQALEELAHRLTTVQERLGQSFAEARGQFLARALPDAIDELRARVHEAMTDGRRLRQRLTDVAITVAKGRLEEWRREQEPRAQALYREGMQRFVGLVNEFRERMARIPGLGHLSEVSVEGAFTLRTQLYYIEMLTLAPSSGIAHVLDFVRPRRSFASAVERDAVRYLERLLEVNSARIQNDFRDRVVESRRRLEREIRDGLRELLSSAEGAFERARQIRTQGEAAVKARVEELAEVRTKIASVLGWEA